MFRHLVCLSCLPLLLLGLSTLAAAQSLSPPPDCAQLLTERCESCHYLTRVCQQLGKKSKRRWKRTLKNMARYGARVSPAEQRRLVDCLSRPAPKVVQLCAPPAGKASR